MDSLARQARKITLTLFIAQAISSAGIIVVATLAAIVGAKLGGSAVWAGVPVATFSLGTALSAYLWGGLMDKIGRRGGLVAGLLLGSLGTAGSLVAVARGSMPGYLAGVALMGTANAAMQLGRFAAAEVHPPQQRGRAISNVVLGGAIGAVVGPLLVSPSGAVVQSFGIDELAGAYAASSLLFMLSGIIAFIGLRPDPRDLGRQIAQLYPEISRLNSVARSIPQIMRQPAALVAVLAMVIGQVVMISVMAITSLHMRQHQHSIADISIVLASHTFGMYAFSLISGRLADSWGRGPVIVFGSITLLLACLAAPLSPDILPLVVSLFLLGLGWNFCFVGGSTLLSDQLSPSERARTQGANDLLVGLASAVTGLLTGLAFSARGYGFVAMIGVALSLVPLSMALLWMRRQHLSAALQAGD